MSSDFEGLPVALLVAMAMQTVPVVTAVGGFPEVVLDGVTGRSVSRGDTDALARAVEELLDAHPDDRRRLGAAARRYVADHFSTQRMMGDIERLYQEVVR
jgi:glycosyltransferase involved in cell wall biosynthesis